MEVIYSILWAFMDSKVKNSLFTFLASRATVSWQTFTDIGLNALPMVFAIRSAYSCEKNQQWSSNHWFLCISYHRLKQNGLLTSLTVITSITRLAFANIGRHTLHIFATCLSTCCWKAMKKTKKGISKMKVPGQHNCVLPTTANPITQNPSGPCL